MTTDSRDDYDTPWKEAVEHHFPEFLAFYFPAVHAAVDWACGYAFLDQELAQVVQDAALGKRILDKLVRLRQHDGEEQWVYVHLEIQGSTDPDFPERLFVYNYRLFDRFHRPVATLAVLADERRGWRPRRFGYRLFGCTLLIRFPTVKLLDYGERLAELLVDPNPFALITAAHLLTQRTRDNEQARYAAKWRLARLLYERDWDKQRIIDLFAVIDWLMRLPPALERQLWTEIMQLERIKTMPYVTSVERFGIEKGLQQGLQQGLEQGRLEGERRLLAMQLVRRFGPLAPQTEARLSAGSEEELARWAERILEARTLDAVFTD